LRWKDYAHGNRQRLLPLDAVACSRRFRLPILPAGFQRLRHDGLLAHRGRQAQRKRCRGRLQPPVRATPPGPPAPAAAPALDQPAVCPACQRGRMCWVQTLRLQPALCARWMPPPGWDTSSQASAMGSPQTSRHRPARRGWHLRRATDALRPPWGAVLASASAWLALAGRAAPSQTLWRRPARCGLRRLTPAQPLRG
jgi:hypothetical protein